MMLAGLNAHDASTRRPRSTGAISLAFVWLTAGGCGAVPNDPGARIFPPQGVIRGTVVYRGPRPCSRSGHIVGNAIILVFDRRSPPPPKGLANTAVNFADVTGDALFADEPRYTGSEAYCPMSAGFREVITASAPFEMSPLRGGSYEIRGFFDYTGNFLPEFAIRNLPERGDVGGGDIDSADALKPMNAGNPNYEPQFLPVAVGVPRSNAATTDPSAIPDYVIPDTGFVADNVTVTLGSSLAATRPYFYAQGARVAFDPGVPTSLAQSVAQSSDRPATDSNGIESAAESDPNAMPVLTIPQDVAVLAPPINVSPANAYYFESKFPHLRLQWGVPGSELPAATSAPFQMQIEPFGPGLGTGFFVWQSARLDPMTQSYVPQEIPEGRGIPQLWPEVVLTRLPDAKLNATEPVVVMQGITLLASAGGDSLLRTGLAAATGSLFDKGNAAGPRPVVFAQDHLSVILRPSAICFPSRSERGTLVTPHPTAATADLDCSSAPCVPNGAQDRPVVSPDLLGKLASVSASVTGCLPTGRYSINVVYADGQAWTVPNEAGACSGSEGATDYVHLSCSIKPRPVLYSQGNRAVVEVVSAQDPAYCLANPVPSACVGSP
jgi:hypothetical protein